MSKLILIVAHEADVVRSIPITLRLAGHRVMLAGTGLDALERAGNLPPDLIVADAALPDMDGPTVINLLRRLPSTETVPSMLLQPRCRASAAQSTASFLDSSRFNSSALLRQAALALALCGAEEEEPRTKSTREKMEFSQGAC